MQVNELIWTDKMRAVMNDDTQILFLNGATGCSKSLVAGIKFMDWLYNAPADDTQFYIIFRDIGTGVRNFLQNEDSFYNMFDFMREPYTAYKEGGIQFIFKGKHSDKRVYLAGADNKESWSKILGSNPDGIWLEELSVLHIDLVREAMGRSISRGCRLIATTNGGLPSQEFYKEFMNHAMVQYRESVPAIELAEMVEDRDYMHYYHFNLIDDAPHLNESQRTKLIGLYPENSFYYLSKVMGVRGFVEGSAYATLMDRKTHLVDFDNINFEAFEEFGLFVDIGSNKDLQDTTKASTIATLVGYTRGCQRVVAIDVWVVPAVSHDDIITFCEKNIERYWVRHIERFRKIVIDSAESILINTWRNKTRFGTIIVKGSVKNYRDEITLVTRCQLKQQMLLQKRLLWTDKAKRSYEAHTRILLAENGAELDLAVQDNDFGDSLTYGLTERWNDITAQVRR